MSKGIILFLGIRRARPSGAALIAVIKSIIYSLEASSSLNTILLRNWSMIPKCRPGFAGYGREKILDSA
jgi:hypothetical protein